MITAPYNFVPLNKEVFYPDWADEVSHDIPFSDGESGEIEITIEAKSPIFIRNHSKDKENPSKEFCHFINKDGAKEFYIPGSSIKGMIRSVLEIMSFSKIKVDEQKLKKTLSVRDMTNSKVLVGQANGCGFLVKNNDEYHIEDCGKILTISYNEIKNFSKKYIKNIENALDKYKQIQDRNIHFSIKTKMMKVGQRQIPKKYAIYNPNSSNIGELVFTNAINNKKNEFVFKKNGNRLYINKEIVKNFKKVYFEDENSSLGQYWKEGKRIPIFYQKKDNKITAIGLTQIFKLAYNKTFFEALEQNVEKNKIDLAETIFGYVRDKKALKGRVQFSHLRSNIIRFDKNKEVEQVLGEPKPSYYPNYIEQTNLDGTKVNRYKTLMDKNAVIRGYKRYPLQNTIQNYPLPKDDKGKINHDVTTKFKPLDKGTLFKGKIRFHNLKKVEIGALLSALTFHGQENKYLHNIGMAKPLGYGKVKIKLEFKHLKHSKDEYLQAFEDEMNSNITNWKNSPQLSELFAMCEENKENDKLLKYQKLEKPNEFVRAKKAREFLQPYTKYGRENKTHHSKNVNNNKK